MPHFTQLATVIVPVTDQDRAIDFYTGTLAFETRSDFTYDTGERWVEVVVPGAETSLTLVRAAEDAGIETRVILLTRDVEGDRVELLRAGADAGEFLRAGEVVTWGGAPLAGNPPMFFLKDPDGNSLLVVAAS